MRNFELLLQRTPCGECVGHFTERCLDGLFLLRASCTFFSTSARSRLATLAPTAYPRRSARMEKGI
jgi:hypothetical protein